MTRPKTELFAGIAGLVMVAVIVIGSINAGQFSFDAVAGGLFIFALLAGYLILRFFREWYIVSDMDLQYRPVIGSAGYVNWSEIEKVRQYPFHVVLTTAAGRRLWISEGLRGYREFSGLLIANVAHEKIGKWCFKILKTTAGDAAKQ